MTTNESAFLNGYSQFLDDSGEDFSYAALSTYRNFAGELSEKEKRYFSGHLKTCQLCSARLQEIDDVEAPPVEAQSKFNRITSPILFRYAMAALFIVAVGIAFTLLNTNIQHDKVSSNQVSPNQPIIAEISDPKKFVPNQVLENFIGRNIRSSSSITLLVPGNDDTLTIPFMVTWEGQKMKQRVTVIIVDNNNIELWKQSTDAVNISFEKNLSPGLYYLKMELNEKLVQVRKFFVIQ